MSEIGESKAKRYATYFYGISDVGSSQKILRCVVTGKERVDWHHLDERKPPWWHYLNIIPISRDLNAAIEMRRWDYLPNDLYPDVLAVKAGEHFRNGQNYQGYACARLGSFLTMPHRKDAALGLGLDADKSLHLASLAILNLRSIAAIPFAIDTLTRNVLPILESTVFSSRISPQTKARLVTEIGSYFREYGLPNLDIKCCIVATHYFQMSNTLPDMVLDIRDAQHRGISYAGLHDFENAKEWFRKAAEGLAKVGDAYPEGKANEVLWSMRILLNEPKRDLDKARSLADEVYKLNEKGRVSKWTLAEVYWTDADSELTRGYGNRANEIMELGSNLFKDLGIVPTSILAPGIARKFREKYPDELYVLPREPSRLKPFYGVARNVLRYLDPDQDWDSFT